MDYFERLIRRAVALPRRDSQMPPDPFEQVAPLVLVSSLPSKVQTPGAVDQGLAPMTAVRDPEPAIAFPSPQNPPPVPSTLNPTPIPLHSRSVPPRSLGLPDALAVPASAIPSGKLTRPDSNLSHPLARADAFMRHLGVPPSDELRSPPSARVPNAAVKRRRAVPDPEIPAIDPVREAVGYFPQRLVPVLTRTPRAPSPPARGAKPGAASSADAPPSRQLQAPRPEGDRIVQTTVVVARTGTRSLDDLAYSAAITRFGLGQG